MDLSAAAAQYFDTSLRIALGASLLVSAAAFVVMYLYMRTVFRESQRGGSPLNAGTGVDAGELEPPLPVILPLQIGIERPNPSGGSPADRSPAFEHAEGAFRKAAVVYVLAGSVTPPHRLRCCSCSGFCPSRRRHHERSSSSAMLRCSGRGR